MKYTILLLTGSLLAGFSSYAQQAEYPDFPKEEPPNLIIGEYTDEAGDSYKSMEFVTVPGVVYTLEKSTDLKTWSKVDSYYGYGQRIITPMVKMPASVTTPPVPPAGPPQPPAKMVGMNLRFASSGGIIITWISLDDGKIMQHHFSDLTLNPSWTTYMVYCKRYGDHFFCLGFPQIAFTAPVNGTYGPQDTAMLACFEQNFATMSAEMAASLAQAKFYTPPPAPTQNQAGFFRVVADWSVDTDGDTMADWYEWQGMIRAAFEFAQNSNGSSNSNSYAEAPAFNPNDCDANNNGIWDPLEADLDRDGVPDHEDADRVAKFITWKAMGPLRFAVFPIFETPAEAAKSKPIQVNNRGEVLIQEVPDYSASPPSTVGGKLWKNGIVTDLSKDDTNVTGAVPSALYDNGLIFGAGLLKVNGNVVSSGGQILTQWDEDGNPQPLSSGDTYLLPTISLAYGLMSPSSIVSKQNQFLAHSGSLQGASNNHMEVDTEAGTQVWETDDEWNFSQKAQGVMANWLSVDGQYASYDDVGSPPEPSIMLHGHALDSKMDHSVFLPNGLLLSMASLNPRFTLARHEEHGQVRLADGQWTHFPQEHLTDFSTNARFGIAHSAVWYNGYARNRSEIFPSMDESLLSDLVLTDTTADGWTLMVKEDSQQKCQSAYVATPFFMQDDVRYTGLDDQSARGIPNEIPSNGEKPEYWVMVPAGGETKFYLKSAACETSPLTLESPRLTFTPNPITTNVQMVTVAATAGDTEDLPVTVKLGEVSAITMPLKAKVMKPRVVKIAIVPVGYKKPSGTASEPDISCGTLPTKAGFETALDAIYEPQMNVTFDVTVLPEVMRETDIATKDDFLEGPERSNADWTGDVSDAWRSDKQLDIGFDFNPYPLADDPIDSKETQLIKANHAIPQGTVLTIYLLAGYEDAQFYTYDKDKRTMSKNFGSVGAFAVPQENLCYVFMHAVQKENDPDKLIQVIAHEMGHHMFGAGHPGNATEKGPAGLNGSEQYKRLMYQNAMTKPARKIMHQIVKGEWDAAEKWLIDYVENPGGSND